MKHWIFLVIAGWMLIWLTNCANPVAPSGGPKDTTPPQLLEESSTPNLQVNYRPKEIVLTFDEFITLDNPARNVIISPPVSEKPTFSLKGKQVIVNWKDPKALRDSTTYTLNFSAAISDNNEGNPVENLVFAFSTGPRLDQLECKIAVTDESNKPAKDITVMLYKNQSDSVVRNELPYYFAKTDADGVAKLTYLRKGAYKLFAIQDENLNLMYDLPSEAIAFVDELVSLPSDSGRIPTLRLFTEEQYPSLAAPPILKNNRSIILWNHPDSSLVLRVVPSSAVLASRWDTDSLSFWWHPEYDRDTATLIWEARDSIIHIPLSIPDSAVAVEPKAVESTIQWIGSRGIIHWRSPIMRPSDTTFAFIDSNQNFTFCIIEKHSPLATSLRLPKSYPTYCNSIQVLPGRLRSYTTQSNQDTLSFRYTRKKKEELAELEVDWDLQNDSLSYIVTLVKGDKAIKRRVVNRNRAKKWNLSGLSPGSYHIEVVNDHNKNGRIDGGNYWLGLQPERTQKIILDPLRANWILEETITLDADEIKRKTPE